MTKAKNVPSTSFCEDISSMTTATSESDSKESNFDEPESLFVEIDTAVNFLTCLLVKAQFSIESTSMFRFNFTALLKRYYDGHWYPNEPLKGSGYRCLRVNAVMHPLLVEAAEICELPLKIIRRAFPKQLTLWVDPGDVSVRIGEHGSIGVLYTKDIRPSYKRCDPNPLPMLNERKTMMGERNSFPILEEEPQSDDCSIKVWNGCGRSFNLLPCKSISSNSTSSLAANHSKTSHIHLTDRCKMEYRFAENVENRPGGKFHKQSA